MIPFVLTFGAIYLSAHLYIYRRLRPALPPSRGPRAAAAAVMFFLFATFFLSALGKRFFPFTLGARLWWVGAWWFGFLFYAIIVLFLADLARLIDRLRRRLTGRNSPPSPALQGRIFLFSAAAVILLLFAGHVNARRPRVNHSRISLGPSCGPLESVEVVMISDLHLGAMIDGGFLRRVVDEIEALEPDLVVMVGDLVDRDVRILRKDRVAEQLSRLRPPLGVYAVTGNHEFITGADGAEKYFSRAGIVFLRDRAVKIAGSFYLAGREEISAPRWGGRSLALSEVLEGVDRGCPVIVLDHQPRRIPEAAAEGADLVLSGHTHHGQLFPLNLITSRIYPVSWGYGTMGETQIYVSSGVGTWGPPIRLGNTPEIVHLTIEFK